MLPADPSPFSQVLGLASRGRRRFFEACALALGLHAGAALGSSWASREMASFARGVRASLERERRKEIVVAIEEEPSPPPPEPPSPVPEPAPPPKLPEPRVAPRAERTPARPIAEPPAPAAAQAGRVLSAEPDPEEPLDLTGNAFVQGNSDAYVGGVTAANGSATAPVRSARARTDGLPGGTGTAAASGVDHSRSATPLNKDWHCPFPPEASGIDDLRVNVAITVNEAGRVTRVDVLGDPGHGFGREAVRCAFRQAFSPNLDVGGKPVTGTIPIVVRFTRR